MNIAKVGVKFPVKSAIVSGNPWILFSEERFQSFLAFLEEGRYEDLGDRGLPADYKVDIRGIFFLMLDSLYRQVASVKYKKESLACPQIKLFNSSTFAGTKS